MHVNLRITWENEPPSAFVPAKSFSAEGEFSAIRSVTEWIEELINLFGEPAELTLNISPRQKVADQEESFATTKTEAAQADGTY